MRSSALSSALRHLRIKLATPHRDEDCDEQLLNAFLFNHDETAFAVLVRRHGPMVLRVCRQVTGHEQDAEDAFQATFLALVRNAAALRNKATLASFLHGIAYRTAMKAKRSALRRRNHERKISFRPPADPSDELTWNEVRVLLDKEIARLPEKYRSVFILCILEGFNREDAARYLGLKAGTVASRLAEARRRLTQRLASHGVELTTLLAAAALATPSPSAFPDGLMTSTLKVAQVMASGENLAAGVPASVAALGETSPTILNFGKAKLAMLLLAVGLLGGGAWAIFHPAVTESGAPPAASKSKPPPPPASALKDDNEDVAYTGLVLDPDGKPVGGAKLYLLYYTPRELPIPVRATSGKDGRFRFTVARKDFDLSASARPWDEAIVVATADGYGVGIPTFIQGEKREKSPHRPSSPARKDLTLRLSKDEVPITGRILDLQGKPVAGITIHVRGLFWSTKGDLSAWLTDLKGEKEAAWATLHRHLIGLENWIGRDLGKIFPATVTGADGRFRLMGLGQERAAVLSLEGPTIATAELFAITRPGGTIRAAQSQKPKAGVVEEDMIVCGSTFEHLAVPCQPIVGVVRDKDTGDPLPGAVVRSSLYARFERGRVTIRPYVRAVSDKEGRYRLTGIPKSEVNMIRAEGPDGQPYLMSRVRAPEGPALEPITVNFQLKRGVWIEGSVTDKVMGKPVPSTIRYAVFDDNPFRKELPDLTFDDDMRTNAKDGSFRFAGLPGRGIVMAQAWEPRYVVRVGADQIKGLDSLSTLLQPLAQSFHSVVEVNPAKGSKVVRCHIELEPGGMLTGTVVDPDGKPLSGVRVAGLRAPGAWERMPLATASFTVVALGPDDTRLLQFSHSEKHLAGSLVVRSNTKGPLIVTLKPAGTLTGRLVRPDGKPFADIELYATLRDPGLVGPQAESGPSDTTVGTFPSGLRTDRDGKFRIENLAPGLKYRLAILYKQMFVLRPDRGPTRTGATVEAGETKNLGDVTIKPVE